MYIWKTEALATDIKNSAVGPREWKKYYLATSIFMALVAYLLILVAGALENLTAVLFEASFMVLEFCIIIFGVNVTYQSNKGDDGIDYIARMTALSFPLSVKILLLAVLAAVLSAMLSFPPPVTESIGAGLGLIFTIALWWRLNAYIKYINA